MHLWQRTENSRVLSIPPADRPESYQGNRRPDPLQFLLFFMNRGRGCSGGNFTSCETTGKLLYHSEPQFPHLQKEGVEEEDIL